MNELIFIDYANWLIEIDDFLKLLIKEDSFLYHRYKHILDVCKYLYEIKVETNELDEEQSNIFLTGFYYLFEQLDNIKLLVDMTFNGNIQKVNEQQKTIELFLNAIDFENDIYHMFQDPEEKVEEFLEIQKEVFSYLEENKEAPIELFKKLDIVSTKIYEENNVDYYSIKEIFYDIAGEFDLL